MNETIIKVTMKYLVKPAASLIFLFLAIFFIQGCSSEMVTAKRENSYKEQTISDLYPILDQAQYNRLKSIVYDKDIREFVYNFWKSCDPTPGTEENELKDEYEKRLKYANEQYPDLKGWGRSDMRRIYLQYGKPDDIERADWSDRVLTNGKRIKSSETWVYFEPGKSSFFPTKMDGTLPGPRRFYFVDLYGARVYKLIYSSEDMQDVDAILNQSL